MTGIIREMFAQKMFGFIEVSGERKGFFFHRDDFVGHWGDLVADYQNRIGPISVEFEQDATPKGPRARNVKRMDFPNQAV